MLAARKQHFSVVIIFSSDHYWHPHWRGRDRGHRSEDASLLPVWEHGEPDQPHRDHGREREDKHVRVHLQVSRCATLTLPPISHTGSHKVRCLVLTPNADPDLSLFIMSKRESVGIKKSSSHNPTFSSLPHVYLTVRFVYNGVKGFLVQLEL